MFFSKFQGSEASGNQKPTKSNHQWHHSFTSGRLGPGKGRTRIRRNSERGFSTLGATLVFLTFIIGVGLFSILHQINTRVKNQIQLDQLTGKTALQLRASIITIENSNERLRIAHAAMMTGCVYVLSCPAFKSAYALQLKIEGVIQKNAEENWGLQKITWITFSPIMSTKSTLPSIQEFQTMNQLKIKIKMNGLISTSTLWKSNGIRTHEWKVAWIE